MTNKIAMFRDQTMFRLMYYTGLDFNQATKQINSEHVRPIS